MNKIGVCVAGISGWVGREVARAIHDSEDLRLCAGVARSAASQGTRPVGAEPWSVPVFATVRESLSDVDVLVDYTSHEAVLEHVQAAIDCGVHVVIGSSGLTAEQYAQIDERARTAGVGVVAAGNFSLTAAVAKAAAVMAARYLPDWEVIDYAYAGKPDSPSGTAREMAEAMSAVCGRVAVGVAPAEPARGLAVGSSRVHSVRLPSFSVSTEVVFGASEERLTIRHDAGESARPYVSGTLLAIRAVGQHVGLIRGLDRLMDGKA